MRRSYIGLKKYKMTGENEITDYKQHESLHNRKSISNIVLKYKKQPLEMRAPDMRKSAKEIMVEANRIFENKTISEANKQSMCNTSDWKAPKVLYSSTVVTHHSGESSSEKNVKLPKSLKNDNSIQ